LALFRENRRDLISWRVLSAPPPAIKAEAFTGGLGITPALQARRNPDPQIHMELAWRILMLVDGLRVGIVPAALKLAGHSDGVVDIQGIRRHQSDCKTWKPWPVAALDTNHEVRPARRPFGSSRHYAGAGNEPGAEGDLIAAISVNQDVVVQDGQAAIFFRLGRSARPQRRPARRHLDHA